MESHNDKVAGSINAAVGSVKEFAGKANGDPDLENEGTIQKTKGQVQKLSGAIKDTITKAQTLFKIKPRKL